jgi:ribosome-binding factor A
MTRAAGKAPSQRQLRVGEELRHALAWIIERGELRDPALAGVAITVTEVKVSPDLRRATAFVVRLGGGAMDEVLAALARARPFLRRQLAAAVKLRYAPDLEFATDTSFEQASRIETLLRDPAVARDLGGRDGGADDDGA